MSSPANQKGKQGKKPQAAPGVVTDPRFAKMHTNREFMKVPKQQAKAKIDDRFKSMLTDKKFQLVSEKDQYGRKKQTKDMDMSEFFEVEGEKPQKKPAKKVESEEESEEDSMDDAMDVSDQAEFKETSGAESEEEDAGSEEDDSSDESDDSDDEESSEDSIIDAVEEDRKNIPLGDQSKRLAIVNCDWERIKAVDVFQACASFVPATGVIKSVTVYLSDFGKQQIEEENKHGPRVFRKSNKKSGESADEDDEAESSDSDSGPTGRGGLDGDEDGAIDKGRLRKYEVNKLRYYFGVAVFDSIASAAAVYKALDGFEMERTGNRFDLRFVPDDVSFEGREIRDSCNAPPAEYVPPKHSTKALEHTDAKLTWDETPPERVAVMTGRISKEKLREMDYQAFLASDSSSVDSDDDEAVLAKLKSKNDPEANKEKIKAKKRAKYADLLSAIQTNEEEQNYGDKTEGDMEITFSADLDAEQKAQELVQKKLEGKSETVFDQKREKERKKKQEKKQLQTTKKAQSGSSAEEAEEADEQQQQDEAEADGEGQKKDLWADFDKGFQNPSEEKKKKRKRGKKKKGKKGGADDEEDEAEMDEDARRSKRELELLVAGDAPDDEDSDVDNADHDRLQRKVVQDERFGALLTDSRFNPDPTNPLAKKLKGSQVIVRERQKRLAENPVDSRNRAATAAPPTRGVSDLIANVKKNVQSAKADIPQPQQQQQQNQQKKPIAPAGKPQPSKRPNSSDGAAGAPTSKRRKLE